MKKIISLLLVSLLLLAADFPACTAAADDSGPFAGIAFPDTYTVTAADGALYAATDDPLQDVLLFAAEALAGKTDFNTIGAALSLLTDGAVSLAGTLAGTELTVRVRITDTAAAGDPDAAGRFLLEITAAEDAAPAVTEAPSLLAQAGAGDITADTITMITRVGDAYLLAVYDPATSLFAVTLEYGGEQVKYNFYVTENRFTDTNGGSDLDDARRVAAAVYQTTADNEALRAPWLQLESTIKAELNTCIDELMAAEDAENTQE